jgi:4-azaleucine resistance transporter AzlC
LSTLVEAGYRAGARASIPYSIATTLVGISFGILARPVMGPLAAIVMSVIVFAGAAQFAALAVLSAGGGAVPAIVAGLLLNLRFVPMGIAIAPSLRWGPIRRALCGEALVDASWAMSNRGNGRFDVPFMLGASSLQYPAWVLGTIAGVLGAGAIGNPDRFGLDAIFPAFFLGLLAHELSDSRARAVALLGGVIAFALIPVAPAGVPIVAAALAATLGLRR